MFLNELKDGENAVIIRLGQKGSRLARLLEMGFSEGAQLRVVRRAPFGDPMEIRLLGYAVSLRNEDARLIEVSGELSS
jgi:Fe2+ transport system protein FeoA